MNTKKINTDNSGMAEVGILDIVHKSNYWIMDAEGTGDTDRIISLVNNLERILAPFLDKPYFDAMDTHVVNMKPAKANTSAKRAYLAASFAINLARVKHRELMMLCARIGFYPIKSLRHTQKMDTVSQTYNYTQQMQAEQAAVTEDTEIADEATEADMADLSENAISAEALEAELTGGQIKKRGRKK